MNRQQVSSDVTRQFDWRRQCFRSEFLAASALFVFSVISIGCGERPAPVASAPNPKTKNGTDFVVNEKSPIDAAPKQRPADVTADGSDSEGGQAEPQVGELVPWTDERLAELLSGRIDGGIGGSFSSFAKQFLVMSRLQIGPGVGIMTASREVSQTELQPVFPEFYHPTLRELFETVALQSKSEWKYDPTGKFFNSNVPGAVADLALFEFAPAKREKPYEVTLADGWKSQDQGHWLMLIPPDFPVGLDIYEVGTYSTEEKDDEAKLYAKVRTEVALQWATRVAEDVTEEKLSPAKVGAYDALYFEAMIPSQLGKEIRWRQWVFMVGNRCFFVVSTILPDLEKNIYPDVEEMLTTFRMKQAADK